MLVFELRLTMHARLDERRRIFDFVDDVVDERHGTRVLRGMRDTNYVEPTQTSRNSSTNTFVSTSDYTHAANIAQFRILIKPLATTRIELTTCEF